MIGVRTSTAKQMRKGKINIGLIGYGYWGRNILRNILEQPLSGKITVCDVNEDRLNSLESLHPIISLTRDSIEIFQDNSIDCVVIATPTSSHYTLAKKALLAKKNVLVEKPLTTSVAEASELMEIAKTNNLTLMVDHVFLYNPVVWQLKKYLTKEFLGRINYVDATRINLGIYQTDTNVLWDLACHDISLINYLIEEEPESVRAIGRVNPKHKVEDLAYLFLSYPSGMLIHINASWASPVKIRKMIIGGEKRMIIYDDIEATNKLVIYDYENAFPTEEDKSKLIDYRLGNITIPKCDITEPLKNVLNEFYYRVTSDNRKIDDGVTGLGVVKILEKAQESLESNGAIINLS